MDLLIIIHICIEYINYLMKMIQKIKKQLEIDFPK